MYPDSADWRRRPGHGKYAKPERERRFLVTGSPEAVGPSRLIEDRYLHGTRLRLRRVTVDDEQVWKLTQKVRLADVSPAEVALTTIYLADEEYRRLLGLPADELTKIRRMCPSGDTVFAVDEFQGRHAGLRLAEVEVAAVDAPLSLPPWLGREVTADDRYAGRQLAAADEDRVAETLSEV
jgi:CYTH domain-containing protein